MIIYLDNCCFNRPFDDQSQNRIRLESEAKLMIQEEIYSGRLSLAWSYILDIENNMNPFEMRKSQIGEWKKYATIHLSESSQIIENAKKIGKMGIRNKDALHIACAIIAKCKFFLTTDDKILNKHHLIDKVRIVDPTCFIREEL